MNWGCINFLVDKIIGNNCVIIFLFVVFLCVNDLSCLLIFVMCLVSVEMWVRLLLVFLGLFVVKKWRLLLVKFWMVASGLLSLWLMLVDIFFNIVSLVVWINLFWVCFSIILVLFCLVIFVCSFEVFFIIKNLSFCLVFDCKCLIWCCLSWWWWMSRSVK